LREELKVTGVQRMDSASSIACVIAALPSVIFLSDRIVGQGEVPRNGFEEI